MSNVQGESDVTPTESKTTSIPARREKLSSRKPRDPHDIRFSHGGGSVSAVETPND
jgi:hypothetical protein